MKVTTTVQLAWAATDPTRLSQVEAGMMVKSPSTLILEIRSVRSPELASMTVCGELVVPIVCSPNVRDMGESLTDDGSEVPFPLSDILIGAAIPSWNIETIPDAAPGIVGSNSTSIPHVSFLARVAGGTGQLVVCLNGPLVAILSIRGAGMPVLNSVIVCESPGFPTCTSPKESE